MDNVSGTLDRAGVTRDYLGAILLIVIGCGAVWGGAQYGIGSLSAMHAGFFPAVLGSLLILVGIALAAVARQPDLDHVVPDADATTEAPASQWRGWICILGGIAAFAVLGRWGGLLPATFAITFISALGDRDNTWRSALVLSLAICVLCVVLFWWALQLQFPLFTWG